MKSKTLATTLTVVATVASLGILGQAPIRAQTQMQEGRPMMQDNNQNTEMMQNRQSSSDDLVSLAAGNADYGTFVAALKAAGLDNQFSSGGPYTIFAPTDAAFAELPAGTMEMLLQPENRDLLRQVLSYHVVEGEISSNQIQDGGLDTLNGGLAVRVAPDRVIINNASVIQPDLDASNGVIHGINRVLLPRNIQSQLNQPMNTSQSLSDQEPLDAQEQLDSQPSTPMNQQRLNTPNNNSAPTPSSTEQRMDTDLRTAPQLPNDSNVNDGDQELNTDDNTLPQPSPQMDQRLNNGESYTVPQPLPSSTDQRMNPSLRTAPQPANNNN